MIIVGIDPGRKGAIVAIGPAGSGVALPAEYYAGNRIVPTLLVNTLRALRADCGGGPVAVVLERQQAFSGQGVSSTFTTGINFGMLSAVVEIIGWPLYSVTAAAWRKAAQITTGGDPKHATIRAVSQRLPEIDLTPGRCRVPQDGIADAAGMVLAGRVLVDGA